jgi:pseudaminic acid synthase
MAQIKIAKRKIGESQAIFIIAELSANHAGSYKIAEKSLIAAKKSGADAVKLQTYTPDTITIDSKEKYFKIKQGTIWDGMTLYRLYKKAYMPWEWQPKLKKLADRLGLILFSSPFDKTAVDFLEKIKVPAYKIASFEITDTPLIEYVASKKKPVIISTGVATLEDINSAINACKKAGNEQIVLLKCTSEYPAPLEDMNLLTIPDMMKKFSAVVGISDHSDGITVPIVSVALGAKVIEKHFILDKTLGGPDSKFSLDPKEFKQMVKAVRDGEKALGKATYKLSKKSLKSREFSRSLFVVSDIKKNEVLTEDNIRSIRPGFGLAPKYLNKILGRRAKCDLKRGTPLSWEMLD